MEVKIRTWIMEKKQKKKRRERKLCRQGCRQGIAVLGENTGACSRAWAQSDSRILGHPLVNIKPQYISSQY